MKIVSSSTGSTFHALLLTDSGALYHCVRQNTGVWQQWLPLSPGPFTDVSCSGVEDTLHVIALTDTGICVHRIRNAVGTWSDFLQLPHQPIFEDGPA